MGDGTTTALVGAVLALVGTLVLAVAARRTRDRWPTDLPDYAAVRVGLAVTGGLAVFLLGSLLLRITGLIGGPG